MKKTYSLLLAAIVVLLVGPAYAQDILNGVSDDPAASQEISEESALKGNIKFDPPCYFSQTLPLNTFFENTNTEVKPTLGNGSVLNQCGNFGVSGFSSPNFLAYNCGAKNANGTVPKLPAKFTLTNPKSYFSCLVGSSSNAGSWAYMYAYNSSNVLVDSWSVLLSPAMKLLDVYGSSNIKYIKITGPCVMVIDNITYH